MKSSLKQQHTSTDIKVKSRKSMAFDMAELGEAQPHLVFFLQVFATFNIMNLQHVLNFKIKVLLVQICTLKAFLPNYHDCQAQPSPISV